jgi:hypothetical protein
LNRNPKQRLGANGSDEIKSHPWFKDYNWDEVMERKLKPPRPYLIRSLKNFVSVGNPSEMYAEQRQQLLAAAREARGNDYVNGWSFIRKDNIALNA